MCGFLATDYAARFPDAVRTLAEWVRRGKVRYAEEILEGIEKAPESIQRLYRGEHTGTLLIRLPSAEL
jgi:NADPH-dependent curcumin reductase CurA